MTALAGMALVGEGSTTTQGKYQENVRRAVDFLISRCRDNGLIGEPATDDRYTYGHGYSLLFLSQVLGEEEDQHRREQLVEVLTKAVEFTGRRRPRPAVGAMSPPRTAAALTKARRPSRRFRACAAVATPASKSPKRSSIRRWAIFINAPTTRTAACNTAARGERPAGDHRGGHRLPVQCRRVRRQVRAEAAFLLRQEPGEHLGRRFRPLALRPLLLRPGHVPRGKQEVESRTATAIFAKILSEAKDDGRHAYWNQGYIGPIYTTAVNLTILQLEKATLPIYRGYNRRITRRLPGTLPMPTDHHAIVRLGKPADKIVHQLGKVIVGQEQVIEQLLIAIFAAGALPAGRRAGAGEDADGQHAGALAEAAVQPHSVHARPDAVRHHRDRSDSGEPGDGRARVSSF